MPVGLSGAPVVCVTGKAEDDVVVSDILRALIVISAASSGGSDKRQAQSLVVRFVGGILAIGEHRSAVSAALVSKVDPLMRSHLKLPLFFIRTLNRADVPVVRGEIVAGAEREDCLEISFFSLPINQVSELDAVASIAPRGQANRLHELRTFSFALDLHSDARRTVLYDGDFRRATHIGAGSPLLVGKVHVPCRPMFGIVSGDRQANRRRQQFVIEFLVENA